MVVRPKPVAPHMIALRRAAGALLRKGELAGLPRWVVVLLLLTSLAAIADVVVTVGRPVLFGAFFAPATPVAADPSSLVLKQGDLGNGYQLIESKSGGDLFGQFDVVEYQNRVRGYQAFFGNASRSATVVSWAQEYTNVSSASVAFDHYAARLRAGNVGYRNVTDSAEHAVVSDVALGDSGLSVRTPGLDLIAWRTGNVLEQVAVWSDPKTQAAELAQRQESLVRRP